MAKHTTAKARARKLTKHAPKPAPGSPEALQRAAVLNATRAWGGLDSAIATDLQRLLSLYEEEDRLVERINRNWIEQRAKEEIIARSVPGFAFAIAPGRRRAEVLEVQRNRPVLLENPPLVMPAPPPPTPEMIERANAARARDAANVRRFNPAVTGTIPSGTSAL